MFAEERPALGPLPLEPFRYYRFGVRTVHLDGCVDVEVPYHRRAARLDRAPKTMALLEATMRVGPSIRTICDHIHRHDGEAGVRRVLGVLALAKNMGPRLLKTPPRPPSTSQTSLPFPLS